MRHLIIPTLVLLLACGCASKTAHDKEPALSSMQVIDRNGFSETVSTKDRLSNYTKVDFLSAQPYQKVMRVYGKNSQGQSTSKITSYHDNGHVWQYLEVTDGRAHGAYKEWHANGNLKLEANVIEGVADITEIAQTSWLFDGKNSVWNDQGELEAEVFYDKGLLHTPSLYYHANGQLKKKVPYQQNLIEGAIEIFSPSGVLLETIAFQKGLKEGKAIGYWEQPSPASELAATLLRFEEEWSQGRLQKASYYNKQQTLVSTIEDGKGLQTLFDDKRLLSQIEYLEGAPDGQVRLFDAQGELASSYTIKDGKKTGEEWDYYPKKPNEALKPKISLFWQNDVLQGMVKTWYDNGTQESQREMSGNKKHGLGFAWFKNGDLMLSEEYENDVLVKGTYYKKGDKTPASKIESGKGIATLHTPDGHFLKKIPYEKGRPVLEQPQNSR